MLRPEQNGQNFAEDIFNSIFFKEKIHILIQISLQNVFLGV